MYSVNKERVVHEKIMEVLRDNPKGLTTTQIVKAAKISRKTIEKHLGVLILENEIYMKQFGVTKVYYPNHRVHHFDYEKLDYNNKTIWFDILESEFGRYLLIQKKKKVNNEWVHEHSLTIPLEQGEEFLKVLTKILSSRRVKELLRK